MTAILIIIVGAVLAWLYSTYLRKQSGETMMGCGIFLLIPFLVIALGVVVALVVLT